MRSWLADHSATYWNEESIINYYGYDFDFDLIMYKMGIPDDDPNTLDVSAVRFDKETSNIHLL